MALFLIYPVLFSSRKIRFNRWLKNFIEILPGTYEFGFDEKGMFYKAEKFNKEIKWEYYSSYEFNKKDGAIYLFNQHKKLMEIISKRLIGEDLFNQITAIIIGKLPPKE